MRYIKLYEEYRGLAVEPNIGEDDFQSNRGSRSRLTSEEEDEKSQDTLLDLLLNADKSDSNRKFIDNTIDRFSSKNSEDGENWSDDEIKRLNKTLSIVGKDTLPEWKPSDKVGKEVTRLSNEFKSTKKLINTVLKNYDTNDNEYVASNQKKVIELEDKIQELKGYLKEMESMEHWWTSIRDKISSDTSFLLKVEHIINIVESCIRELDMIHRQCNFTYKT